MGTLGINNAFQPMAVISLFEAWLLECPIERQTRLMFIKNRTNDVV